MPCFVPFRRRLWHQPLLADRTLDWMEGPCLAFLPTLPIWDAGSGDNRLGSISNCQVISVAPRASPYILTSELAPSAFLGAFLALALYSPPLVLGDASARVNLPGKCL